MDRPVFGSGSDVGSNPYDNTDIDEAVSLLESRMQLLMRVRDNIRDNREFQEEIDHRMARSMAHAVVNDGPLIVRHLEEERLARHDHRLAERMQAGEDAGRPITLTGRDLPRRQREPTEAHESYLAKLAGRFISRAAGEALMPDNVLAAEFQASGRQRVLPTHTCCACNDNETWFNIYTAPCGDEFCGSCLKELFAASFKDESLFPPKCCKTVFPIESKDLRLFIGADAFQSYGSRQIEVETTNRIYCHSCATFILPATIDDNIATCPACRKLTCAYCKSESHTGPCKEDEAGQAVLELAEAEQWKRCYKCLNIVSISTGCNHMTCRCGAEFCYVCNEIWKSCQCILFEERRLLERAEEILDRDGEEQEHAEGRQARLEEVADLIRENHECNHPRNAWRTIAGSHECETCQQTLPNFILECRHCRLRACVRCRRHRL